VSDLKKLFSSFGSIYVDLKPMGCAFVSFRSEQEASYAMNSNNGTMLNGRELQISWPKL
jgi:RNA recognition motif-containing protein